MNKIIQKGIYSVFGLTLLIPQVGVLAESLSQLSPQSTENYVSSLNPEGLTSSRLGNCFDVYNLVNLEVNINLDKREYQPADVLILKGNMRNNNTYSLPELTLKANIFKIEQEGDKRIVKTVDEFVVADNINVASLASYDIDTVYTIPTNAAKGEYEVTFSVVQDNQISIAGLTFADDSPAVNLGFTQFTLIGDNQEKVSINQSKITINDQLYNNLEPNPLYSDIQPKTIKVPIQNNTDNTQKVTVVYEVYSWSDDLGESSKVREVLNQEFELAGKSTINATYALEDIQEPVYYVKVTVVTKGEYPNMTWDNIANIRLTNQNIANPRIVFTGFNTSPYNPEKDIELVTCIHNGNDAEVEGILENVVQDEKGKVIAKSQYKGKIAGKVDGIYTPLPKNRSYNKLIVTSTIKDASANTINTVNITYDCQELDSNQCKNKSTDMSVWVLFITLLSLMGSIFIGVKLYRNKRFKV